MSGPCKVIVFAKAPVAGYAKTRLARTMGEQAAARLAARMVDEAVGQALAAGLGPVELCCAPDTSHPHLVALAARCGVALSAQGDGDLGQRMARAFERALAHHGRVLLIGTDAPALDAAALRLAADALCERPAVLAPAHDGGYVLVGLARTMPTLFQDVSWSTDQVMVQSRARLQAAGLEHYELPVFHDIDEGADLVHVPPEWLAS